MKRYPEVNIWVAVNEPYAIYNGGQDTELWGRRFGNNYEWIAQIIRNGYQANSNASFIINQYGIEIPGTSTYIPQHFSRITEIGEYLKAENVPIAGIGLQGHFVASDFSDSSRAEILMDGFRNNIRRLREVYEEVYITELDVITNEPNQEMAQARAYQLIVRTALEEGVDVITIFGLTDKDAWKPDKNPLLFDSQLQPKPAYYSVLQELLN